MQRVQTILLVFAIGAASLTQPLTSRSNLHEKYAVANKSLRVDIPNKEYNLFRMWSIVEERLSSKMLDKPPPQIAEKYAFWCAIVRQSGPQGLRAIKSFHAEKLSGKLSTLHSSRLSQHWRVLYRANRDRIKDPTRIYPGQRISIPTPGEQSSAAVSKAPGEDDP